MSTANYKRTHPPKCVLENESGKPHQGVFIPSHPEKVIGGEVICRSGWEMAFARWCDDNPYVLKWGGEPTSIQYRNPGAVDLSACRKTGANPSDPMNWPVYNYYPDFYVELKTTDDTGNEIVKRILIEIKPKYQTERPVAPPANAKLKEMRAYNNAVKTYLQNIKKWEAAKQWCDVRGIEFKVYTEVTLERLGII